MLKDKQIINDNFEDIKARADKIMKKLSQRKKQ